MLKPGSIVSLVHSLFFLLLFFTPARTTIAQEMMKEKMEGHSSHVLHTPAEIKWMDGPASLPKGTKIAILEGELTKSGPFTFRAKIPANWKIPPHFHPGIEHVTVLSGAFYMGFGDSFDESNATKLPAGGFAAMQPGTHHYAFTMEETEIQVHAIGPWGITYVNPAEDPMFNQASN